MTQHRQDDTDSQPESPKKPEPQTLQHEPMSPDPQPVDDEAVSVDKTDDETTDEIVDEEPEEGADSPAGQDQDPGSDSPHKDADEVPHTDAEDAANTDAEASDDTDAEKVDATGTPSTTPSARRRRSATLDGRRLEATAVRAQDGSWKQGFTVGSEGGQLVVTHTRKSTAAATYTIWAVWALTLVAALPLRRGKEMAS